MDSNVSPVPAHSVASAPSSPWIAFSERMPGNNFPGDPSSHGYILVTNNISATNRWGKKSHVWLVLMVHQHDTGKYSDGKQYAEAGEITAFSESDQRLRFLTHWRPAFPEEWPEFQSTESTKLPKPKVYKVYNEAGGPVGDPK